MLETPTSYRDQETARKCAGHRPYRSEAEALNGVRHHQRTRDCLLCRKEPASPFFCLFGCGSWHFGHSLRNRGRG